MSHFCVGVVTKEKPTEDIIDKILAPYYEGIKVEPYVYETAEQYLKKKREDLEEYRTKGNYAEYLENPEKYEAECANNPGHLEYVRNFMTYYNMTDEQLLEERANMYCPKDEGSSEWIDDEGNVWTTYNPISKWDWYVIGGRWSERIPLKSGNGANAAQIKDIDFGIDIDFEKGKEKYQDEYNNLIQNGDYFYKPKYYSDNFPTIEDYIIDKEQFITFAIINDGKWFEKGTMGWFGCSSETPQEAVEWNKTFYNTFIENLDKEWYFTIVDCHI